MDVSDLDESVGREETPEHSPPWDEQSSPPPRQAPETGDWIGLVVFVLFVVALPAFGRAPLSGYAGTDGSRVNFDLLSVLGIIGALLGVAFVIVAFKRGTRPWSVKRTLGILGTAGLLAHSTLALASPLAPAGGAPIPPGTAGHQYSEPHGPETWSIDGEIYEISATYYLHLPEGYQYTIEYPYQFRDGPAAFDQERALDVAFPLMGHALEEGLYDRSTLTKVGSGRVLPTRIGVVLLERVEGGVRGYRVTLALDEIRERVAAED